MKPDIAHYQEGVLKAINLYRISKGLTPLMANSVITEQAKQHSIDMAHNTLPFGHDGFKQRMDVICKAIPGSISGAENIAYFKVSPQELVKKWLTSPGHRKNIQGDYNLTGIGVATDSKGRFYTTQIFINNKDA